MPRRIVSILALSALWTLTACGAARAPQPPAYQMGAEAAKARAKIDSVRYPYTVADIDFMTGMIHHHAQAIVISQWAESHGASAAVQRLTGRIINAQTDEITLMSTWLGDRNQPVPRVDHGAHGSMMPGMLSAAQLDSLGGARGARFDQLFLTYMIQHHRGAVSMVRTLFSNHGAGQNEAIFKFTSDAEVDQSTEIRRMLQMLLELDVPPPSQ